MNANTNSNYDLKLAGGDRVQSCTGEWYTVFERVDNIVYVFGMQGTIHITKIINVKKARKNR